MEPYCIGLSTKNIVLLRLPSKAHTRWVTDKDTQGSGSAHITGKHTHDNRKLQ